MAEIAVSAALVLSEVAILLLNNVNHRHFHVEICHLHWKLKKMVAFLTETEDMEVKAGSMLETNVLAIRNVAYDIEDILDEYLRYVQYQFHPYKFTRAYMRTKQYCVQYLHISSMIDAVREKIKQTDLDAHELQSHYQVSHVKDRHEKVHGLLVDDEVVGFDESLRELSHHLVKGGAQANLVTIAVVGPVGSGKTALVCKVYKSKDVQRHFDCRAWVRVTDSFDESLLLKDVIEQFGYSRCRIKGYQRGGDIRESFRNYLQRKRYLVVLDDIWNEEQWSSITKIFPKISPGSRIIVTTINNSVASSCVESDHCVLKLAELSRKEAWDLFCKHAFRKSNGGQCPQVVKEWASKIFDKCELPLEIVAVAGLLEQKPLQPLEWKKFHVNFGSMIQDHSVLSSTYATSYKNLTSDLKKCLLYFSNFPEDQQFGSRRLCRLWVAEGFSVKKDMTSAEDVAEDQLNKLIQMNLVSVVQSDLDGRKVKCRIRKLVLEFIIKKTKEENFASVLSGNNKYSKEKVRRLSIHGKCLSESDSIKDLSSIRSLFVFNMNPLSGGVKFLYKFRLMRVLDMQGAAVNDEFLPGIFLLTLLRYLSLRNTNVRNVPNGIKTLTYLETLDLRGTKVTKLPAKIVRLVNMRHLFVYSNNLRHLKEFGSGVSVPDGIEALIHLQKLSVVEVDKHNKIIKALEKMKQMRKLGLQNLKTSDGVNLCVSIQNMQDLVSLDVSSSTKEEILDLKEMPKFPPNLQRLQLKGRLVEVPVWIPKLDNLFKISLMWSRLKESPLRYLQDLYNLMELHMVDSCYSPQLVFEAGKFKKLKILYLGQFEKLEEVLIGEGAIPELRKLTIAACKKMKTLPLGINNLAFVENLHFYDMPNEFISHVKSDEGKVMVTHIPIIHSHTNDHPHSNNWSLENLS